MYREIKIKATREGQNKAESFSIITDAMSLSVCEKVAHWYLMNRDFDCETEEEATDTGVVRKLTEGDFTIEQVRLVNFVKVFRNENPAIDAEGYENYQVDVLSEVDDERTNKTKTIKERYLIPVEHGFEQAQEKARDLFETNKYGQVDTVSRKPNILELVLVADIS